LDSIASALKNGSQYIQDFRLAGSKVSSATRKEIESHAEFFDREYGLPTRLLWTEHTFKYPIMRQLFYSFKPSLASATMWFDDDSYFEIPQHPQWWENMWSHLEGNHMIGQFWLMNFQGNQWRWIQDQPWYNPAVGLPHKQVRGQPAMEFCQGAWWVIWSHVLAKYDWPVREIRHNGGDSMLGELFRHQGLRKKRFYGGVRINADWQGRHSKMKRRGRNEGSRRVGSDYDGQPLDTRHQLFDFETTLIGHYKTADSPQFHTGVVNYFEKDNDRGH
jgi:hypothetical protein